MKTIARELLVGNVCNLLDSNRSAVLLGPRQCGKTTIARIIAERSDPVTFFDLENPSDLARLADPMLALAPLKGLVVLDEIQRCPDIRLAREVLDWEPQTSLAIGLTRTVAHFRERLAAASSATDRVRA